MSMAVRSARTDKLWRRFCRHEGLEAESYLVTRFRTPPEMAEELLARMFAGATRALTAPMHYFGVGREEPLPVPGEYTMLVDRHGRPRVIWRTSRVKVAPLSTVENAFIWQSGLDGCDRADWLRLRHDEFTRQGEAYDFPIASAVETLFENIEVVWPTGVARSIRRLTPYLERGAALLDRLEEQRATAGTLESVMAQLQTAVLVVQKTLQVTYANSSAEILLRREDGMSLKQSRLRTRWPADQQSLAAAIYSACTAHHDEGPRGAIQAGSDRVSAIVQIGRGEHQEPYSATVLPLRHAREGHKRPGEAMLFLSNPDDASNHAGAQEDVFCCLFHLTAAEGRLAVYLTSGASLVEAAHTFGVSHNTVRKQLRAIFDKTDARRQADLVRLMQNCRSLKVSVV
jgi:DNA-binding CsgD family transcriptional regulator/uncharacterized protein YhfF